MPRLGRDADHPEHLKQTAEMACAKITAPTTIVAHSFGGAVTNEIIGVCPAKVKKIIYVSALVPMNGEHPTDMLKGANQKAYMSAVKVGKDRITPKKQIVFLKKLDASLKLDQKNLPPVYAESMLSLGDVIENNAADFNKIAKYYIYTSDDKVIPLDYQKKMTARLTLAGSDSVKSGHLPLLTKPAQLAQILQKFIDEKTDL